MTPRFIATSVPRWRWMAKAGLFLVMATTVFGYAQAQESADDGTMSVTIVPSGVVSTQVGDPGSVATGTAPVRRPGTVTAFVSAAERTKYEGIDDQTGLTLIVVDDRGTAAGWAVVIGIDVDDVQGWVPDIAENRNETIRRLLPAGRTLDGPIDGVDGQRTLGPMGPPVPVLGARPGSGNGVYLQQLALIIPGTSGAVPQVFYVVLPFAP